MKYKRKASLVGLASLILLAVPAKALAQEAHGIVPALRDVLLNVAGRVDNKLGTWVSGNTLTAPEGENFIADLAGLVGSVVAYVAECLGDLLVSLNFL